MACVGAIRLTSEPEAVVVRETVKLSVASTKLSSLMGMLQQRGLRVPENTRGLHVMGMGP